MCLIMKEWRILSMNEQEKVERMVEFIEEKERQLQVNKITADTAKSDIVKQILDELERVSENEN